MVVEEKSAGMGFGTSMKFSHYICKVNTIKPPLFGKFNAVIYDLSAYGTHDVMPSKRDVVGMIPLETKNKNEALMLHRGLCQKIDELGECGKSIREICLELM